MKGPRIVGFALFVPALLQHTHGIEGWTPKTHQQIWVDEYSYVHATKKKAWAENPGIDGRPVVKCRGVGHFG